MALGPELEQWLSGDLTLRLRQAIESMAGEPPEIACAPAAESAADLLWLATPLTAGAGAVIYAGAPEAAWGGIGRKILNSAGIEEPDPGDLRSTYQEVLGQALSAHAQAIGSRLQREVLCETAAEAPAPEGGFALDETITVGGDRLPPLRIVFSAALLEILDSETSATPARTEDSSVSAETITAEDLPPSVTNSRTLELLLEVELPVSVSFGRAQLPLKDVLKLTSGSIVELNRSVSEPVEIIVNNCVIARGEVVVVEGNYGVRIHHIISRQERLRTLN